MFLLKRKAIMNILKFFIVDTKEKDITLYKLKHLSVKLTKYLKYIYCGCRSKSVHSNNL